LDTVASNTRTPGKDNIPLLVLLLAVAEQQPATVCWWSSAAAALQQGPRFALATTLLLLLVNSSSASTPMRPMLSEFPRLLLLFQLFLMPLLPSNQPATHCS
jgi:hypothetical protein